MIRQVTDIACALGRKVPAELAAAIDRLSESTWPEVAQHWSRLTPTGFPVEITISEADSELRWAVEVAGPEMPEHERLRHTAICMSEVGQAVPARVLRVLETAQLRRNLQYGAWLAGRTIGDAPARFKLYAEIPEGPTDDLCLPNELGRILAHAPKGTLPRMFGVEPLSGRLEIYLRLPTLDPEDLRAVLNAAGHPRGVDAIENGLPDGLRRLAGRRIGFSFAVSRSNDVEASLFVTARTLFPAAPEELRKLIPVLLRLPDEVVCPTIVTLRLNGDDQLALAVGVTARTKMPLRSSGSFSGRSGLHREQNGTVGFAPRARSHAT